MELSIQNGINLSYSILFVCLKSIIDLFVLSIEKIIKIQGNSHFLPSIILMSIVHEEKEFPQNIKRYLIINIILKVGSLFKTN